MTALTLVTLEGGYGVCRLPPDAEIPVWATGPFSSATRTTDELSIICAESNVPVGLTCERGWRGLRVAGKLDFGMVGILSALLHPLAEAGISVLTLSTFDTDYLFVRSADFQRACESLCRAGHVVR